MQLRPRNNLTSGAFANTYVNKRSKGDRPQSWSWANKRKRRPSPVRLVSVADYNAKLQVA